MAIAGGRPDRGQLAGAATLVAGPIYLALPLGGLAGLRWTDGREVAVLLVLVVVASDTLQYYTGRALGRRKLAPVISPKKTVEGAVGGFVGATLVMTLVGAAWLPGVPLNARVGLGLTIAGLGIVGDLLESALKRAADVKDSSHLIPGHGGVLDRIDALLLAAPVYIAFLKFGPWQAK
jgi:phosphatidate cytidylyltransferase